jgi:hypothetical protein
MTNVPVNTKLYEQVKTQAKRKFAVWPSAYASGWLVKTYKARGGTYRVEDDNRKPYTSVKTAKKQDESSAKKQAESSAKKQAEKPLARWYDEKWVDVCRYLETGKLTPCGRHSARHSASPSQKYPYCRPSVRISDNTPKTLDEISRVELQRRCRLKRVGKSDVRVL